ncbi:hypothetical protein ACH4LE_04240 [Streptomyces sp. NPDC017413]|uniref:hypothetical protein n=1 Tax=Streptomyces sp. NPDC017413 TaxID=3364994 RepID=UPI00378E8E36
MAMSANPDRPEESRHEESRYEESRYEESRYEEGRYEEDERLACGRLLTDVWEAWDTGRSGEDPHSAECPFCSDALADLTGLGDAVRRTCEQEPGTPDATAITARVMDLVRLELRPGRPLPLGEPGEDHWMVESAVARILRAAVDSLPGVRAGSCRIAPLDPADPTGALRIRLEVAASLGRPMRDLADVVRARVAEVADRDIGIRLATTDVLVVDILDTVDTLDVFYEDVGHRVHSDGGGYGDDGPIIGGHADGRADGHGTGAAR